jgi:hypothetical protein
MNATSRPGRTVFLAVLLLFAGAAGFGQGAGPGAQAAAAASQRVAVLEFEGAGVTADMLRSIKQSVEEALYGVPGIQVIEREKIELILKEQEFQLSDLADQKSVVQIGQLLAADIVVTGSVNRLADVALTVKFLNVRTAQVSFIQTESFRKEGDIPAAAQRIARGAERALFPERFRPLELVPTVGFGVALPIGDLAELAGLGIHSSAGFYFRNLGINGLDVGVEAQFQSLPGPHGSPADWFRVVPLLVVVAYDFTLAESWYLRPQVAGGAAVSVLRYDPDGYIIGVEDPEYVNESAVYGQAGAGFAAGWRRGRLSLELGAQYNLIIGTSPPMMIVPVWVSAGLRI